MFNSTSDSHNYDKIKGTLIFTQDGESAVVVEPANLKSFTLIDREGNRQLFRVVPSIDTSHFVNVLAEGLNYNFYKLTLTKFIKSNYHSDGMTSTGNPYDEYTDDFKYFLENVKTKQISGVSFKRKALRILLADQKEKSERFLSDHRDEAVNEEYTRDMINFLNK